MEHSDYNKPSKKQSNTLPINGNESTMNLNPLILANIQSSSYFKVTLFKLKTYHEVIDEIYYQVKHLEPWERGSRKTSGQTGMCGGVRGVGAGGIVSSAFCLLYKLYTLRLTRKQVNGLMSHTDSPYIRALGFMYVRYTQPPSDLFDWYEEYLQDEEEIDVKAGGGQMMTIGQMLFQWLQKLDWFSTLFPRIPVPVQKQIEAKVLNYCRSNNINPNQTTAAASAAAAAAAAAAAEQERRFDRGNDRGGSGGGRDQGADRGYGRNERDRYDRGERSYRNEDRSDRQDRQDRSERQETSRRAYRSRSRSKDREYRQRDRRSRERYGSREKDRHYKRGGDSDRRYR